MTPPAAKIKPSSQAARCSARTPAARKRASTASEAFQSSQLSRSSKRIRKPSLKVTELLQQPPPGAKPLRSIQRTHKEVIAESDSDVSGENEAEEDGWEDIDDIIPPPLQYMSVWRIVVGKDTLPGVKSGVYEEGAISMRQL
ncbi:hypothetical protein K469DRAFT_705053, partial [Zopfia rhizophila CBS 207.26]